MKIKQGYVEILSYQNRKRFRLMIQIDQNFIESRRNNIFIQKFILLPNSYFLHQVCLKNMINKNKTNII
jgi:hypothetical protein